MRLEGQQGKSATVKWQSGNLQFKSNKLKKKERTEHAQFYNIVVAQSHRWMTHNSGPTGVFEEGS